MKSADLIAPSCRIHSTGNQRTVVMQTADNGMRIKLLLSQFHPQKCFGEKNESKRVL